MQKKTWTLVEACEPNTTVNLHFHSVTLLPLLLLSLSPVLSHSFFIGMSHIGQAGNYTGLSWEPVVKHTRYLLKLIEGGGREKNTEQEKWKCKVGEDKEVGEN